MNSRSNAWKTFVQQNYSFLRFLRVLTAAMVIFPLFGIAVNWHGGSVHVYDILVVLYIAAVFAFFPRLLRKYKPE